MTNHPNQPIEAWEAGDTVTGFALLTRYERREDRNGRHYLDLELTDETGSMVGKVWSDSPALEGEFGPHDFVAFKGSVKSYRDQLQITVVDCRRANDGDRRYGFDEAKLVPSSPRDLDELWARLEEIYTTRIERPMLETLARETLAAHGAALKEHPAAKQIHHAYRGGLLEHTVQMAELALGVCATYPELDADLVLLGVLFHDLGKTRELGAMPVNEYSVEGRMVGHVVIGRDLLLERCQSIPGFPADLRLHLEHLVLSHQGELAFGSPVMPMTSEALALHAIDNLDSKLAQLRRAAADGAGMRYLRGMGRFVYLGEEAADREVPDSAADSKGARSEDASSEDSEAAAEGGASEDDDTQPTLDLAEILNPSAQPKSIR